MERELTERERAVLDFLLSADFEDVDDLRRQAASVLVTGGCECGCPSIDFGHPDVGPGINPVVNAEIKDTNDTLFVFTQGPWLAGIEYVGYDDQPAQLPDPAALVIF
ncbi:MAG: hypothetical protein ABIR39_06800 [Nocardioides sp.]|uniref:hypothetical protein n=1 Tax=Nocardioides sp. TaxID=35761 RepID=UPI0032670B40